MALAENCSQFTTNGFDVMKILYYIWKILPYSNNLHYVLGFIDMF